jgi:cytochrome b561
MSTPASSHYTRTAIALHWVGAALILANLAFGLYLAGLPLSPAKLRYLPWHKWIGVTVLLLSAARLAWRLGHPAPELPPALTATEMRLARLSHVLLYVLFFASPLTGWLFSSAAGIKTVYLGLLPLPDLVPKDKALAAVLRAAHKWINYSMAAVIAVHVAAALKHHFHDRDDVLRRMLVFKRGPAA